MHLFPIAIVAAITLVALAVLMGVRGRGRGDKDIEAYYLRRSLYSPAERSFLGVLETLDFDGIVIASKVRLGDVFGVKNGLDRGRRKGALNRITAKHVDFLLIQKSDGRPLLGIELDDSSHQREDRKERDEFVNALYSATGLPILHVAVKSTYDPKVVRRQIDEALGSRKWSATSRLNQRS